MSGCHPIGFNKTTICVTCQRYLELCVCGSVASLEQKYIKMQQEYDKQTRKLNIMRNELNVALINNRHLQEELESQRTDFKKVFKFLLELKNEN